MKRLDYLMAKWRGIALLVLGRTVAAREVFDGMLQRWPDDPYALASRAHLLTEAGLTAAALADSHRLVALRPEHGATWFNHGYMLEASERFEEVFRICRADDGGWVFRQADRQSSR